MQKQGAGLVLDAQRGLVVCSRMIVPVSLGDVTLTVADSVTIPARILFLHPTQNFAILSYDPSLLGSTPLLSAQLSPIRLAQGHKVTLVAYNHNQRPVSIETTVTDDSVCNIPPNATPRFRAINFGVFY